MGLGAIKEKIEGIGDIVLLYDEPLSLHTGFKTGGKADLVAVPESKKAFFDLVYLLQDSGTKFFILGKGKNVLALDEGYDGVVVKTENALSEIEFKDNGLVCCGAGVSLSTLCKGCAERGLSGLEFAYGIPGTVGGAVFMNAGAYDGEMKDVVRSVETLDKFHHIKIFEKESLDFSYRHSFVQETDDIICGAVFELKKDKSEDIAKKMKELMKRRKDKQPLEYPSCGSTFKRPTGSYASLLIDRCGLRGRSVGGACVSEKHCGFIVNKGGATSDDILSLIEIVKKEVKEKSGYSLCCEIRLLK